MNANEQPISVVAPVSGAFEHTKRLLFRPFDAYRWLAIGFTAWLATLGENWGGGGGGGGGRDGNGAEFGVSGVREAIDGAKEYVVENFAWLLPLVLGGFVLLVGLVLLFIWLSSRGRFMFLHNVALNRAEVVAPWHAYRRQGNSLFLFRVVLAFLASVVVLPLLALLGFAIYFATLDPSPVPTPVAIAGAVGAVSALVLVGIVFVVIEKLTQDFVVPIMWLRQPTCRAAWSEFGAMLRAMPVQFLLYLLFHILLSVAAGILIIAVVLMTCCVAGCLFAIPYIGTVFLLPVLVFFRSYSLIYFAQYGPDHDVFRIQPATSPYPGTDPRSP
ncbi:MAG: hypothetical protein JNL97_17130 [Verrucomicrobiales bacterium]|nr:hypothetical protein [Verrucomicrobiales bacterium]